MNSNFKHILLTLCLLTSFLYSQAQTAVYLEGEVDSTLKIGQQVPVSLGIIYNVSQGPVKVTFPTISDSLGDGFQIVKKLGLDTSLVDPQNDQYTFRIEQKFLVTAFLDGQHTVGPFKFEANTANFYTDSLTFQYELTEVDTSLDIKDIKDIEAVQYGFVDFIKDNWKSIVGIVALLAILVAAIIFFIRRKRNAKPAQVIQPIAKVIPPHVEALEALAKIKSSKLWQHSEPKEFYSQLTDIVRTYIEKQFQVHAREQTTAEILYAINAKGISNADRAILNELLPLSDMVKFAKEKPSEVMSEGYIEQATQFVQHTKPQAENQTKND